MAKRLKRDTESSTDRQQRRDESARLHREKLDRWMRERSKPGYARFRLGLLHQILEDKLRPFEVAAILEAEAGRFAEITHAEIDLYRAMGEQWQQWTGVSFAPESAAQGAMEFAGPSMTF